MSNSSRKPVSPKLLLRQERERRSWTHQDVADFIGLPDPHTVGRWERGVSFPNAHYRRELCRIFGKSLEELGLVRSFPGENRLALVSSQQQAQTSSNLPTFFTSLVGREQDVAAICAQLRRSEVRLLTLMGTGGIGKTRLAVEVATRLREDFSDGVYYISLATLRDASLVIPTIAAALGIKGNTALSFLEQIKAVLQVKKVLLVLDNFEQVAPAAPFIEELLESCPAIKVLVTSRQVLHVQAEHAFIVTPLSSPNLKHLPEPEALTDIAAVALFVQRARAHLSTFHITAHNAEAVAQLCVRLDGLPLAIELAAARIRLCSPQKLLERLSQDMHILKNHVRGVDERHRTLHHTIKWSYDQLNSREQWLFRHMTIFVGGATLDTLEAFFQDDVRIADDVTETIFSLLNKSLLQRVEQEHGEPRFTMLETIRDFGMESLRAGDELDESMQTYATYFLHMVEQMAPQLISSQQEVRLMELEGEHDNLRVALGWLIEQQKVEAALHFCDAFGKFCGLRGYWSEERRWVQDALRLPYDERLQGIRGRVLRRAGHLAYRLRDLAEARTMLEESVVCSRQSGDQHNLVGALSSLGWVCYRQNEITTSGNLLRESVQIARTLDDNWVLANALESLGRFLHYRGDLAGAYTLLVESVDIARTQVDKENRARILTTLVMLEIAQGHMPQAEALAQESAALASELGTMPLIALTLDTQGEVALFQGEYEQARQFFEQRIAIARELGDTPSVVNKRLKLADIALAQRDFGQAAQVAQALLPTLQEHGNTSGTVMARCILADVKRLEGDLTAAHALYQQALQQSKSADDKRIIGRCIAGLAQALLEQEQLEQAADFFASDSSWLHPLSDLHPIPRADYEQARIRALAQWHKTPNY